MAGRKQHFIPRHYLKSFVINDGKDKLWMYRRGLPKPVPVARDDRGNLCQKQRLVMP